MAPRDDLSRRLGLWLIAATALLAGGAIAAAALAGEPPTEVVPHSVQIGRLAPARASGRLLALERRLEEVEHAGAVRARRWRSRLLAARGRRVGRLTGRLAARRSPAGGGRRLLDRRQTAAGRQTGTERPGREPLAGGPRRERAQGERERARSEREQARSEREAVSGEGATGERTSPSERQQEDQRRSEATQERREREALEREGAEEARNAAEGPSAAG